MFNHRWAGAALDMNGAIYLLALMTLGLCCTGCWPYRFTTSPGVTGMAIDDKTEAPVDGAEAFVSRATDRFAKVAFDPITDQFKHGDTPQPPSLSEAISSARLPAVITGPDGRFSIPQEKRWGLYIIPTDVFTPRGSLIIRREGYQDVILSVSSWGIVDLGDVRLKRVQP